MNPPVTVVVALVVFALGAAMIELATKAYWKTRIFLRSHHSHR